MDVQNTHYHPTPPLASINILLCLNPHALPPPSLQWIPYVYHPWSKMKLQWWDGMKLHSLKNNIKIDGEELHKGTWTLLVYQSSFFISMIYSWWPPWLHDYTMGYSPLEICSYHLCNVWGKLIFCVVHIMLTPPHDFVQTASLDYGG